jgi:hypothetical protein
MFDNFFVDPPASFPIFSIPNGVESRDQLYQEHCDDKIHLNLKNIFGRRLNLELTLLVGLGLTRKAHTHIWSENTQYRIQAI